MIDKIGLGSIAKSVAGGFISKTWNRLKGANIPSDSRIAGKRSQAKWSGRNSKKDWRVKLTIPQGSLLEGHFFNNNTLLYPLYTLKGITFPLTPSMIIQHSANYNPLSQTHSNYPFQAYQNSQVDQMNIIGEFPVQNSEDAKYWVATVNFLRTVTKMFFGKEQGYKGNPPPILHLSGYGDHMFDKVPVIVQSFNVELRNDYDYISTRQEPDGVEETAAPGGFNIDDLPQTWAPTLSTVSAGVIPVYSRESLTKFSLQEFANGTLNQETGIGFI